MKNVIVLWILFFFAGMASSQDVRYNFDKGTDFPKFKTYKWILLKNAQPVDALVDKQIREAVDTELSAKGLTKVDADNADLLVGYQAAVGTEREFTAYGSNWGYGPGWYRGGWYGGSMNTVRGQTSTIYVGSMALDMYDAAQHDLVWRGMASKTIDPKAKPEKQQKNLQKAVAKLLRNYPPAGKN